MGLLPKISLYFFMVIGFGLSFLPKAWFPSVYDVRYTGISSFIAAGAIFFVPRLFQTRSKPPSSDALDRCADLLQHCLAIALMCDAAGCLGLYQLYKIGIEYDKILHFAVPVLGVIASSMMLQIRFGMAHYRAVSIGFLFVVSCGIMWEIFEYGSDYFLHTHLSGEMGTQISSDTKFDLLCDAIGSVIGTIIRLIRPYWLFPEKQNNKGLPGLFAQKKSMLSFRS